MMAAASLGVETVRRTFGNGVDSTSNDADAMGGLPAVPDDDPGVELGEVGPTAGDPISGWPLPGVRFVVQPNAARDTARESATALLPKL
jgi:hypothetical protein